MSADISQWLLEGIDATALENSNDTVVVQSDNSYSAHYGAYERYSDYSNTYSDYYDYYAGYYDYVYNDYINYSDYSNYYNYYDYYNYSNAIAITLNPVSQSVRENETVTFSVRASNRIDSCQWYYSTTAQGTAILIPGATSPSYTFVANSSLNNRYYFCIVRRGGNSSTSSRALLTVNTLTTKDLCIAVGTEFQVVLVGANPPTTTISSIQVADESVATVTSAGLITGVAIGQTNCTVVGSNGVTTVFKIIVLEDPLVAVLMNCAIAIRAYRNITYTIPPNMMANMIRGTNTPSYNYDSLTELFQDIAAAIREKDGTTEEIAPVEFYTRILKLIG